MTMGFFPRPTDSWPTWLVIIYWVVIGIIFLAMLIKTIMKAYARVPQGSVGMRMRLEKPIRVTPREKGEVCVICDDRRVQCDDCKTGRYCTTCPECPVHDELKLADPGLRWQIPFTHSMREQSLQDQTVQLTRTPFERDGKKYEVDGAVTFRVARNSRSIFRALFRAKELNETIVALATRAMGVAAATSETFDVDAIGREATEYFNSVIDYGVYAVEFVVKPIVRSDAQLMKEGMSGDTSPGVQSVAATQLGLVK